MPRLLVHSRQISLDFEFWRALSIGRHISNSLALPDAEVSRRHAQIFPKDAAFVISDLSSRNGLLVNGRKCREHRLAEGDEITVGSTLLFFEPPKGQTLSGLLSKRGARLWRTLPQPESFVATRVTTFSAMELDEMARRWIERSDVSPPLPDRLQSHFLRFALSLDRHFTRGDLCRSGLDFIRERIGAMRMAILASNPQKDRLQVLARSAGADDTAIGSQEEEPAVAESVLRIALGAERAVYCPKTESDHRFAALAEGEGAIGSFLAVPIFCHDEYYGLMYLDQPPDAAQYDFKCLLQAHLAAGLMGKSLHWLEVGRGKTRRP